MCIGLFSPGKKYTKKILLLSRFFTEEETDREELGYFPKTTALSHYTTLPLYKRIFKESLLMCSNPSLNLKSCSLLILSRSHTPSYWASVLLVWSYWEVIYWETILIIFLIEDLNSSIFISYSVLPSSYEVTGIMRGVIGGLWNGAKQNVREENLANDLESQRGKY